MPPVLDIHVDNGEPGADVIAMRISLNPTSGEPEISDKNSSSIEDMLKEMLKGAETPEGELPDESLEQLRGMQAQGLMVVEETSSSPTEQSYQQVSHSCLGPHTAAFLRCCF